MLPPLLQDQLALYPQLGLAYYPVSAKIKEVYNEDYFDRYQEYETKFSCAEITNKLNSFRVDLVNKYTRDCVLDVGVGAGTFIQQRGTISLKPCPTMGYDINPKGIKWLKDRGFYIDPYESGSCSFNAISLWDVIEHIPDPSLLISKIKPGGYLFISTPIYSDISIETITKSKHYRTDEHCWYPTRKGLRNLINMKSSLEWKILEHSRMEVELGRDEIETFVFQKTNERNNVV